MRIITTLGEILHDGNWVLFCLENGINEFCLAEGTADSNEEVILTKEQYERYL